LSYSNIIFDFDGTITDSKRDIAGVQLSVLEQLGVNTYREEDLFPHIGKTLEETFTALLPETEHHRIADAARLYSELYPTRSLQKTVLFPGVRETLEILRLRGKQLAVASTKRGPGIKRATDHFGITGYFVQLQGSDNMPFKPDPFIVNKILADQHWVRRDTLMVGDTDKDMLVGKNANVATCAVTYGACSADELAQYDPDFMISSFPKLLSHV